MLRDQLMKMIRSSQWAPYICRFEIPVAVATRLFLSVFDEVEVARKIPARNRVVGNDRMEGAMLIWWASELR